MIKLAFALFISAATLSSASAAMITAPRMEPINTRKVVHVTGTINPAAVSRFITQMFMTKSIPGDRVVVINSPGGYVSSGLAMMQHLDRERRAGIRIVCIVVGTAASMAFNLLTRCDLRLATENSKLLFHSVAIEFSPFPAPEVRHTPAQLLKLAAELAKEEDQFRLPNAKALDMTLDEYDLISAKEFSWAPELLVARGYLHAVAEFLP